MKFICFPTEDGLMYINVEYIVSIRPKGLATFIDTINGDFIVEYQVNYVYELIGKCYNVKGE